MRVMAPLWDTHRVTAATGVSLLAPLAATIADRGPAITAPFALAGILGVVWPMLFAALRRAPFNWHGLLGAWVFALLLPPSISLWQMGISLSFGLVFGDLIFGGRGRSFLNTPVVGLAFLLFSFPSPAVENTAPLVAIAAAGSGMLLLAVGLLSWRVTVAFGLCIGALIPLLPPDDNWRALLSANAMLGLVFLIGDPVAGASTNPGRWLYGGLAAGLVVLLGHAGSGLGTLPSVVFGALLASIFAPLLDQMAVHINVQRRARRQHIDR